MHAIAPHFGLVHLVAAIGYPGLFLAIFFESAVFFGFFLPGSSMLFTAGILASVGIFNVWVLVFAMAVAASLGDSAGYWFGRTLGFSLFSKKDSRFFKRIHLERAKDFYDRHGVLAVVLARFIPIVRTFAPVIAGIVTMRYRKFLAYNIAGALLWSAAVTFLGYYLGRKVPFVVDYITPLMVVVIIATIVPILFGPRKKRDNE